MGVYIPFVTTSTVVSSRTIVLLGSMGPAEYYADEPVDMATELFLSTTQRGQFFSHHQVPLQTLVLLPLEACV